jgi:hypothetical protein
MSLALEVLSVILVAIAMALALAHALELPGKMRLGKEEYLAVQTIYYPGFTLGGMAEPAAIVAVLALLVIGPDGTARSWLTAGALMALIAMHLVFWIMTQPVNRFWVRDTPLTAPAQRFFGTADAGPAMPDWTALRDRWERSHLLRAIAAMLSLILLVTAIAL